MKTSAVVTAVTGALALGGYVAYRTMLVEPEVTAQSEPESVDESPRAEPAQTLPDFSLANLAGEQQSIRSWPDQALVINFWATWCAPCLREIPLLKDYQQQHPDAQIIGIALDSDDAVQAFAADMEFNYPVLVGPQGFEAAAALGAEYVALPLTVFAAADQRLLGMHMGELHAEHLEAFTAANAALAAGELDFSAAAALIANVE